MLTIPNWLSPLRTAGQASSGTLTSGKWPVTNNNAATFALRKATSTQASFFDDEAALLADLAEIDA